MYQHIFRDPGGESVVRRIGDAICPDGSIIMVPPGAICIVAVNGVLSEELVPGRHTVHPGLSPFFARFMNMMTDGEAPVSVDIYYITTTRIFLLTVPTEEFLFIEDTYKLHVHASAACSIGLKVNRPKKFLETLCGFGRSFDENDFQPLLLRLFIPRLREALARILSITSMVAIQSQTNEIGTGLSEALREETETWGLLLHSVKVLTVNIRAADAAKIAELDEQKARGSINISLEYQRRMQMLDSELNEIQRLYGDIQTRTVVEAIRNLTSNQGLAANPGAAMAILPTAFWTNDSIFASIRPYVEQMLQSSSFTGDANEGRESTAGRIDPDNARRNFGGKRKPPVPRVKK